jgi:hypothetical protein
MATFAYSGLPVDSAAIARGEITGDFFNRVDAVIPPLD